MNTDNVWVFAEHDGDRIEECSLELLGRGRVLADRLGVGLEALLLGHEARQSAQTLIEFGADTVLWADHESLADYRTLPYARILIDLVRERRPQILLFGATPTGRDLAPRIASALCVGLTADCTDLIIGSHEEKGTRYDNLLLQIRPAFGGNIIATIVNPETRPQMATVREGVMPLGTPDPRRVGTVEAVAVSIPPEDLVVEMLRKETKPRTVNLKGAPVIVAGGMGVGSREGFAALFELAHLLGGEVGASRAAVDAGFVDRPHQVGQTGTTVRPKLYVACGISGSIQHRAGMDASGRIVAINTDPGAPIFDIAHYAIVGDVRDVLTKITKALRSRM
ncbi:electron transfer flavoprotein subunit alpha/FixB family protein [Candidatus Fermentibacteria bacterium]|nr:electron transfer flavoprotein subunit alpha/FixB family protein [Candidatus Fermentibacteria bacterium]